MPCWTATKLEASLSPTIHLVLPWIERLRKHCAELDANSEALLIIKDSCRKYLQEKFKPHRLHQMAIFLNPRQRSMRALSEEQRVSTMDIIKCRLRSTQLPETTGDETDGPPAKHQRVCKDDFYNFDDIEEQPQDSDEINFYLSMQPPSTETGLLSW